MFSLSWERMCEENELISHFIEIQILITLLWFETNSVFILSISPLAIFQSRVDCLWALFSRVRSSSVIIHFSKRSVVTDFFLLVKISKQILLASFGN